MIPVPTPCPDSNGNHKHDSSSHLAPGASPDDVPVLAVLDTNVCLDLFVFHDPYTMPIMQALQTGRLQAVTRSDCRDEWLAVLHYRHLPLDDENRPQAVAAFDQAIRLIAPAVSGVRLPVCSDKDDQKFLELARDAKAQFLITKDKALLKLARKTAQAGLFTISLPQKWGASLDRRPPGASN